MLRKIRQFVQLAQNMGIRYISYRILHELEKRIGLLKLKHPQNPKKITFVTWEEWKKNAPDFLFGSRESLANYSFQDNELSERIEKMKEGTFRFFYSKEFFLGKDFDWITHPVSGKKFSWDLHWSLISDFDPNLGDIKYVWEKSRFTYLIDFIRYDQMTGEDHSEWIKSEIDSWIAHNPINSGPNWRCSQEISLRIFNWCFALNYYRNSHHFNEEFWSRIQPVLYWSLHHVYHHINFSRIAVRNNHAITETLFLAVSEWLFPFIPETKKWAAQGRKWFEEEVAYQVYTDGTFLQFSMNYHRVLVQLLTLGIRLGEIHQMPFSKVVYDRAYASLRFLLVCQDSQSGFLPNYGANDGALFFPFANQHFRDYRPQLDALHQLLTGEGIYHGYKGEDWFWWGQTFQKPQYAYPVIKLSEGAFSFEIGGYYVIRDGDSLTFIRCGNHKDRPQHADNLHLDVWVAGDNILLDSGTYQYNCEPGLKENFEGTIGHNTVSVEKKSQMKKGSRFIWYYWTQSLGAKLNEEDRVWKFEGKISAFRFLFRNCTHFRKITKIKGENHWEIFDSIQNVPSQIKIFQVWNFEDFSKLKFLLNPEHQHFPNQTDLKKGFYSGHYGELKEIQRLYLPLQSNSINTTVVYKPA
jgi:hypothetical protein